MIRCEVLDGAGGYNTESPAYADYDLWLRLIQRGVRSANLRDPLYVFYEHDSSV